MSDFAIHRTASISGEAGSILSRTRALRAPEKPVPVPVACDGRSSGRPMVSLTGPIRSEANHRLRMHEKEQDEIKSKLADLVPKDFREVFELFDFAIAAILTKVERRDAAKTEIKTLKTLRNGIFYAQTSEWARITVEKIHEIADAKRQIATNVEG